MIEYRPILGFPHYLISNRGDIVSTRYGSRPRKLCVSCYGYNSIRLTDPDGVQHNFLVHKLVLETFVGPCPEGKQTRHLNGIRTDNHVENLVWGTPLENYKDKILHGTHVLPPHLKGEAHGSSVISETIVREILVSGETGLALAAKHGISNRTVSAIRNRRIWKHVQINNP